MKLIKEINRKNNKKIGLYECPICKKHFETSIYSVNAGRSTKCKSCSARISQTKHGEGKGSKLYNRWIQIRNRCNNKNLREYKYYGGKGVKVCDEWNDNYLAFKKWMIENGYEPNKSLSIDRINSDMGYEPSNCRIITISENTRRSAIRKEVTKKIKISQDDASEICEAYSKGIFSLNDIAKCHNVTKQAISYIIKRQTAC